MSLPPNFRLTGSLKHFKGSPFERDFLLSVRLKYLHVRFMLRLVCLESLADPEAEVLHIAEQMLALVVEAILFREYLVNSGSSTIWKASTLGAEAAGL